MREQSPRPGSPLTLTEVSALVLFLLCPSVLLAQGSFTPAPLTPEVGEARRIALLIGIDDYADPALPPLQFASKDARELGAALLDPTQGGFDTVQVLRLRARTSSGVLLALQRWKQMLRAGDTALLYFSGHGMRWVDERGRSRLFLAASNTLRQDPLNTAVPVEALQDFLATLPASRRVLIIDACFTGDGKVDEANAGAAARAFLDERLPVQIKSSDKEAQLYSTTYGRPALESKSMQNGVYTGHLIAALGDQFDAADMDGDLVVTVSEAHDYARDRTMERTKGLQVPMVFYKVIGREEVVLAGDPRSRQRVELAFVSAYEGAQQGLRMFVNGAERGTFPRSLLVPPGHHRVEFRTLSGKIVDRGRFEFSTQGVYSVRRIRDSLGGGRHIVSAGFLQTWLPGAAYASDVIPTASGFRFGYSFRLPSRKPLLRKLALSADLGIGFMAPHSTVPVELADSPRTTLIDFGFGPMIRLDLPFALLSVRPRLALSVLVRDETQQPFLNWVFGSVGVELAAGFRPINRVCIGVQYSPMLFNAALSGEAKTELMHRLGVGVDVGF
jgi:hypothetical protein